MKIKKESVNQLFEVSEGSTNSPWNQLKEDAKKSDFITFRTLVARRDWLMETEHLYRITS